MRNTARQTRANRTITIGRCFRSVDFVSEASSKFVAIDKEAKHQIVHRRRFRKANRATDEPFQPGAQIDVLAFDPLCMCFANRVLFGGDMALIGAPPIGVKSFDTQWL